MSPVQTQEHNPLPEHPPVPELRARVESGGAAKYHQANAGKGKLFARERVRTCRPTASSPAPRRSTAARWR